MSGREFQGHLAERRFELLVQSVTDYAIYMLDTEGRVVTWNAGAERFKGYCEAEIVGEHFSRFFTQEDRDAEPHGPGVVGDRVPERVHGASLEGGPPGAAADPPWPLAPLCAFLPRWGG